MPVFQRVVDKLVQPEIAKTVYCLKNSAESSYFVRYFSIFALIFLCVFLGNHKNTRNIRFEQVDVSLFINNHLSNFKQLIARSTRGIKFEQNKRI